MNGAEAAFWTFIGSALLFSYLAMREAHHVKSVHGFFHDNRLTGNVLSYTAANITLGTGLVYIFSAIGSLGILFLVAPFMMLLGYLTLARFLYNYADEKLFSENLLKGLSLSIDNELGIKSNFAKFFSIILIIVFSLILSFEIFASSKLIASIMYPDPTVVHEIFTGTSVFLIALLYSLWGGFKAVQTTDQAQLLFVSFLLLALAIIFFSASPLASPASVLSPVIPPINTGIVFSTIAAGLAAFTTQYYSIINLCAASQQEQQKRRDLFVKIGVLTFLILAMITAGAIVVSVEKGIPFSLLSEALKTHSVGTDAIDITLSIILMLGMVSVLFSTVDTLIVSITQIAYSNVCSRSESPGGYNSNELRHVRLAMAAIGPIVFAVLAIVWFFQPNLFGLLLAIVSGNDVLAPLIVLLVVLHKKGSLRSLRGPWGVPLYWVFFVLFFVAVSFAVSFSLLHLPYTPYIGPVAFVISSGVAISIINRKVM